MDMKSLLVISFLMIALGEYHSITAQRIGASNYSLGRKESTSLPVKLNKPAGTPLAAGTYSIGVSGDFTTIQDAFDKLSIDGISGPVTLKLIDEIYISPNDSLGFILIGPIPGSSKDNRLTIRPAENKNVLIKGEGFRVMCFVNTSYVTLDGIELFGPMTLTFRALHNASYSWNDCLVMLYDSDYNIVQNITFISEDYYRNGTSVWLNSNTKAAPDNNLIFHNFVMKGSAMYVNAPESSGIRPNANIIRWNYIGSDSDSLLCWGIQVERCNNTIVENNIVQNIKMMNTVGEQIILGLNSFAGSGDIIRNNVVHNLKASSGYSSVGILLSGYASEFGGNCIMYNNMVYDIQSVSTQINSRVAGLQILKQINPKIYFNTIYLTGQGSTTLSSTALHIASECTNVFSKNNILINLRKELYLPASSIDITNLPMLYSDYNNLYSPGLGTNCNIIINGAISDLGYWQSKGKDLNSISIMPRFKDNCLHVDSTFTTLLESGGKPVENISTDIDGELRNHTTPDIGADEFGGLRPRSSLIANPAEIDFGNVFINQSSDTVEVYLKNQNRQPVLVNAINKTLYEFEIVAIPQTPFTILPNDSVSFKIYFKSSSFGLYTDKVTIINDDNFNPFFSIKVKGNVSYFGPAFQSFYSRINSVPVLEQKSALVDSFLVSNPVLPLIEDSIAIFIYKGEANCISIVSDFNYWTENVCPMYRISGTDLWFRAHTFEMDARIDYKYCINNTDWIVDERNPRLAPSAFGSNSELAMPEYVDAPEIEYYTDIPHGFTYYKTITSNNLGNTRTVYIYTPPGYNPQGSETYPIILFHDGGDFINLAKVNNVFDYLIDKKKIQRLIGVFVPPVERDAEYAADKRFLYEAFIIDELMPFIDSTYRTKKDPKSRAMLGISFGGLITTQICYNHPESFGLAAPYSASYRASGMSVYNSVIGGPKKDVTWYLDWGKYEPTIVISSVKLRDSLMNKGYDLIWNEWHEGHSWGSWRAHLDNPLEYFFPANAVRIEEENTVTPGYYFLSQNYPNPFNPVTKIKYSIPELSRVIIKVYDIIGNEIAILVNEEKQIGNYEFNWNAASLASGVYFYQIKAGSFVQTRKMILLK
jgi:enterochelin esterase family protein